MQTKFIPGYTGFIPQSKLYLTPINPGSGFSQGDDKISSLPSSIYGAPPLTRTLQLSSSTSVTRDDFRRPNPKGLCPSKDLVSLTPKPFIATTEKESQYVDFVAELVKLETLSEEECMRAFNEIDTDHSGFIDQDEVRELIRRTTGKEPAEFTIRLFHKIFDANKDGKVTWDEFRDGLSQVYHRLEGQIRVPHSKFPTPQWWIEPEKTVIGGDKMITSSSAGIEDRNPQKIPIMEEGRMVSTTRDLFKGTAKASKLVVPGFGGHIPADSSLTSKTRPTYKQDSIKMTFTPKIHGFA